MLNCELLNYSHCTEKLEIPGILISFNKILLPAVYRNWYFDWYFHPIVFSSSNQETTSFN